MTDDEIRSLALQHTQTLARCLNSLSTYRANLSFNDEAQRVQRGAAQSAWNLAVSMIEESFRLPKVPAGIEHKGRTVNVIHNPFEMQNLSLPFIDTARARVETALGFWRQIEKEPARLRPLLEQQELREPSRPAAPVALLDLSAVPFSDLVKRLTAGHVKGIVIGAITAVVTLTGGGFGVGYWVGKVERDAADLARQNEALSAEAERTRGELRALLAAVKEPPVRGSSAIVPRPGAVPSALSPSP